jgi:AraC family transcriptional regulator of arabinose operon
MRHDSTFPIRLREVFRDQILYVIPRPVLERSAGHPLLHSLLLTDVGWYPYARYHYCERHAGAPEHILLLCVGGSGWYDVGAGREVLRAGQALVIPADRPHVYGASEADPWSIHWAHFAGLEGDYFARLTPEESCRLNVDATCSRALEQLFQRCTGSLRDGFVQQRLIFSAKTLQHLLAELYFNNIAFSPTTRTSRFRNLEPTLSFLYENLHRPISLAEMAAHAELSESHFSRLFKEQTGHSPVDYFIYLKMQHACSMLTLTRSTIHEIGSALGYNDAYYFSRLFKKVIGVSPREYRSTPQG